jgi:hypothetical protein
MRLPSHYHPQRIPDGKTKGRIDHITPPGRPYPEEQAPQRAGLVVSLKDQRRPACALIDAEKLFRQPGPPLASALTEALRRLRADHPKENAWPQDDDGCNRAKYCSLPIVSSSARFQRDPETARCGDRKGNPDLFIQEHCFLRFSSIRQILSRRIHGKTEFVDNYTLFYQQNQGNARYLDLAKTFQTATLRWCYYFVIMKRLRVCPESLGRITEFSEHEAN